MNERRYLLEPYKGINTRYHCPDCQQREKTFSRYIDTKIKEYIAPTVGRCNRESNCGYHYTPKQYFQDNNISFDTTLTVLYLKPKAVTPQQKPVSFIPVEIFKTSLQCNEPNYFIKFLIDLFRVKVAKDLISRYFITTSTHWNGATIFWQIDISGKIKTGKIMLYNPATGKRVKEPFNHITWVHKALKMPEFELKQCFFGEHLLQDKTKPVAIVESEKTAVISSVYFPQLIWLAAGSLNNITPEKCQVLRGRKVILFPDCKGFKKWNVKAKELNFTCSDLLEHKATPHEREQGLDLADYLIKYDYREFTDPHKLPPAAKRIENNEPSDFRKAEKPKPGNFLPEIEDLEQFFKAVPLPAQPVKLNQCSTITDISLFVESHLSIVKAQSGNKCYRPYMERLMALKAILTNNLN